MTETDGPNDDDDDDDVATATAEAFESLLEAYSGAALAGVDRSLAGLTALVETSDRSDLQRDVTQLLAMLAERFPTEVTPVLPELVDGLDGTRGRARDHLLLAIGHVAAARPGRVEPFLDDLLALLHAADTPNRNVLWIVSHVAEANPSAVAGSLDDITPLVSAEDEDVRRHAIRITGAAGTRDSALAAEHLTGLLDALQATSVYRTSGRALVCLAPALDDRVVDGLLDRLEPGRPELREHAAWTLVILAEEHPGLLWDRWPTLVEIVREDEDQQVQNSLASALAALAIHRPERDLVSALAELLDHGDPFVGGYVCRALGDVATATLDPAVLTALEEARTGETGIVSAHATETLQLLAEEHPGALADISPELVDNESGS